MRLALIAYLGFAAVAHADTLIASYAEGSGALPPAYAWDYVVKFGADGTVNTRYCKGFAEAEPHCATRKDTLPAEEFAALQAALAPIAADLAANPVAMLKMFPIGGGSIEGHIYADGADLLLPHFPVEQDAPRVAAAIEVLRKYTPAGAIEDAKSRAVQPQ
jgi:hypothetical protein